MKRWLLAFGPPLLAGVLWLALLWWLMSLAGCASEPTGPVSATGDWTMHLAISGRMRDLPDGPWVATTCVGQPPVHLDLVGDSLHGVFRPGATLTCNLTPFAWAGWLVGSVEPTGIRLFDGYCVYDPTGTVDCHQNTGALDLALTGTWSAAP